MCNTWRCVEWRNEDLCPYECPSGRIYKACGPTVKRTCENYRRYLNMGVSYSTEGCFCPDDKVLFNGDCVSVFDCSVCMDETRTPRRAGEQWQLATDPCVYVTCQDDGSLLQTASSCPLTPTCESNEILYKVVDGPCCPIYACESIQRDEDCADVNCLFTGVPVCNTGEETVAVSSGPSGCCFEYECVCRSHLCPYVSEPSCEEGARLAVKNLDSCCPVQVCECDESECPLSIQSCPTGYVLKLSDSNRCCQTYECVCDYSWCEECITCQAGETLVANAPTADGCCTSYSCQCEVSLCPSPTTCAFGYKLEIAMAEGSCCESYECVCGVQACPTRAIDISCPSEEGYRLIPTGRFMHETDAPPCCPTQSESTCVCDILLCSSMDIICAPYERKYQTNPGACCPGYTCECDQATCPMREVLTCDASKKLVEVEENSCCTRFSCECGVCQQPQQCPDGWDHDDVHDDCGCVCRTCIPPQACIYDNVRFEPGTFWMDDVCTDCSCSDTMRDTGGYEVTCTAIKCGTCSAGYTYVPIAGQCCGDCVPNLCHYGGNTFAVGQTWTAGSCTKCTCETDPITNGVYSACVATSCPPMDLQCSEEDLRTTSDGCCTYCARTSQACEPAVEAHDYITFSDGCSSSERVNITKCAGSCDSESIFSMEENRYVSQCSCCTVATTRDVEVEVTCYDDSTYTRTLTVAQTCACQRSTCSP